MKKLLALLCISIVLVLHSCKKNPTIITSPNDGNFDNSILVKSTIIGQVLDENSIPLEKVQLQIGGSLFTTDSNGVFYFNKITTPKHATVIQASKNDYYTSYKTLEVNENKDNYIEIVLSKKENGIGFQGAFGTYQIINNTTVTIPDSALETGAGVLYTGSARVYVHTINPAANTIAKNSVGTNRGVATNNKEFGLCTFSMLQIRIEDAAGNELKIKSDKAVTVKTLIEPTMLFNAPDEVPVWNLNTSNGLWVENAKAKKENNMYQVLINNVSALNFAFPFQMVRVKFNIKDMYGLGINACYVDFASKNYGGHYGAYANADGMITTYLPSYNLYNVTISSKQKAIHTRELTLTDKNEDVGNLFLDVEHTYDNIIQGTMYDCSGNANTDGLIIFKNQKSYFITTANNVGKISNYSFMSLNDTDGCTITYIDMKTSQEDSMHLFINKKYNDIGSIKACNGKQEVTCISVKNNITNTFEAKTATGQFTQYTNNQQTYITSTDSVGNYVQFSFDGDFSTKGKHILTSYADAIDATNTINAVTEVEITSYPIAGGYIEGKFSTTINGHIVGTRTITCSFRVRRW